MDAALSISDGACGSGLIDKTRERRRSASHFRNGDRASLEAVESGTRSIICAKLLVRIEMKWRRLSVSAQ